MFSKLIVCLKTTILLWKTVERLNMGWIRMEVNAYKFGLNGK